jgi:drug/metabolite transporter (DMT)-like permease
MSLKVENAPEPRTLLGQVLLHRTDMNRLTGGQWLGVAMMVVGVCAVVWGLWFLNDPPMPGFRYVVSLQWSRILGGIAGIVFGALFFRKLAP